MVQEKAVACDLHRVFVALVAASLLAAAGALPVPSDDALALVQQSVRDGQAAVRWRSRIFTRVSSFKVGDRLEFRVAGTKWLNCTVVAEGDKQDTYTINVPALPVGRQQLDGVQASALRDPQKEAAKAAERLQAEKAAEAEKRRIARQEALLFEDGEEVIVDGRGKGAGKQFKARILNRGRWPHTYDLELYEKGIKVKNAEARLIRKVTDMHYEACEIVDLRGQDGETWHRTKVLGPGTDVGYVHVRYPGSKTKVLYDVSVFVLRKVPQATAAAPAVLLGSRGEEDNATTSGQESLGQSYEVGHPVLVQLNEGNESKPWVRSTVLAEGEVPGTYNIRVTATVHSYDLCDVPAERLRETPETLQAMAEAEAKKIAEEEERQRAEEEEARRKAEEAAQQKAAEEREKELDEGEAQARVRQQAVIKVLSAAAYRPGQELQFNAQGSQWVNCTVLSLAVKPHVYNIYVPSFPEGFQEIADVQGKALRSFEDIEKAKEDQKAAEQKRLEEQRLKKEYDQTFEPNEHVQVQVKGKKDTWADAVITEKTTLPGWYWADVGGQTVRLHSSVLRRDPAHTFDDGENAQVRSENNQSWIPCIVTRRGEVPGTYNIYFPNGHLGHRDKHNIPARAIHHIRYVAGEPVEVKLQQGKFKGLWFEAEVTGVHPTLPDAYSVRLVKSGIEFPLVGYKFMRRSEAAMLVWREKMANETRAREEAEAQKEKEMRERTEWVQNHTFEDGESVQVSSANGKDNGTWTNMTVLSKGTKPNTYTLVWRNKDVFKNVRREIIRKDPETQAAKLAAEELAKKQVEAEEAERQATARERAKRAEAWRRMAEERERKLEEAKEQGEAAVVAAVNQEVERVSDDELQQAIAMTESIMEREKRWKEEHEKQVVQAVRQQAVLPATPDDEDISRRQAEWDEAIREDEEAQAAEAQTAPQVRATAATPAAELQKQEQPAVTEKRPAVAEQQPADKAADKQASGTAATANATASTAKPVKWEMDEQTAQRQAEWDAMLAEDEEKAASG